MMLPGARGKPAHGRHACKSLAYFCRTALPDTIG